MRMRTHQLARHHVPLSAPPVESAVHASTVCLPRVHTHPHTVLDTRKRSVVRPRPCRACASMPKGQRGAPDAGEAGQRQLRAAVAG